MPHGKIRKLIVVRRASQPQMGTMLVGTARFICALGRTGIVTLKREGDGATPRASMKIRRIFYRADRMPRLRCLIPMRAIHRHDAWCDDLNERRYNTLIRRPEGEVEERLWRKDHLYNVVIELGWNDSPVRKGRGSAIFWHVARPGFTPTAGCVAVNVEIFRKVLPRLSRHCSVIVL